MRTDMFNEVIRNTAVQTFCLQDGANQSVADLMEGRGEPKLLV